MTPILSSEKLLPKRRLPFNYLILKLMPIKINPLRRIALGPSRSWIQEVEQKMAIANRVSTVVTCVMGNHGLLPPKDKGDDLMAAGLNSMGMVALMLAIEGEFNVTIPNTDLIPTNFRSIRSVQTLVEKLHADQ